MNHNIFLFFLGVLGLIIWINYAVAGGVSRKGRTICFHSNLTKYICGFPGWIQEVDYSLVLLNFINMLLLVLALGKPFFIGIPGAEKIYHFLTNSKLAVYIAISWAWIVVLCFWQSKELKDQMYHRETFDLQEKKGILKVGADQTPFQYVFTTSKRMEVPTKLIIFVPDSYNNITLDEEGNISKYDAKEGWKKTYNMGAYEELSDALVRAGFATVRFAREKGEKNLVMDLVTKKEIVEAYLDREEYDGEIILLAHGLGNTELRHIVSERRASGIISLCGAAMGMWESYVNRGVWLGGNRKRLGSRSKRVEEFVEIAKETPVFLGYVEYDPYYDDKLVDEIRAVEEGKIEYHYYQDTDFTLRFRRKNTRKGAYVDGQKIDAGMPRLNPKIVEDIIKWQSDKKGSELEYTVE